MENLKFITGRLIDWYTTHKRTLPWRDIRDPYKIWISEIILQQTRVNQGLGYYNRFIERFPDVVSLADASEQEVLTYWQGLGYYSRARNLHYTAREIKEKYNGVFPDEYQQIRSLKGIGEYTAAAIASFAYGLPYPAIDGNVFRILSRLFALAEPIDSSSGKKVFAEIAHRLIAHADPATFNQATMEFGALQCTPTNPDCFSCPLNARCMALASGQVSSFPVKTQKTKTKDVYLYYFHILDGSGCYYLKQRKGKGIWQNLFEFPVIESDKPLTIEEIVKTDAFCELFAGTTPTLKTAVADRKHVLSHRIVYATFYTVVLNDKMPQRSHYKKITPEEIDRFPLHRLMEQYLA